MKLLILITLITSINSFAATEVEIESRDGSVVIIVVEDVETTTTEVRSSWRRSYKKIAHTRSQLLKEINEKLRQMNN